MKICIVGLGAIGGFVAHRLVEGGLRVSALARGATLAAVRERGLVLHEANEVYTYWSCARQETNPRVRAIWERMVSYELGQLHFVMDLFKSVEHRDPAEFLPAT